jgi:glycosyltransferase involved in cell wall biosynthesis
MKVLINAYACCPHMGSEPGMSWNWIINLSKYCDIVVITEGEFKEKIEKEIQVLKIINVKFYYLPVSHEVRKMCWNQGDWRFYWHYRKWQKRAFAFSKEIIEKMDIDIIHQLNMIGFREPGYLWKIKELPFVWGPISVDYTFPTQYISKFDLKKRIFFSLKNSISYLQFYFGYRVKKAIGKANLIIAANSKTKLAFERVSGREVILINETGCNTNINYNKNFNGEKLNLLWIGKFDIRKQLELAIRSVSLANDPNIFLHIVGSGDQIKYIQIAKDLGIQNQCLFYGQVDYSKVQEMMREFDLLFFTSLSEGTPHVVLESISNNLPILCFNTCGQGDVVTKDIGIKIEISNPKKSTLEFSDVLKSLLKNKMSLKLLSNNCFNYSQKLSWDNKAKELVLLFKKIVNH